jgi:hypothetical protein
MLIKSYFRRIFLHARVVWALHGHYVKAQIQNAPCGSYAGVATDDDDE